MTGGLVFSQRILLELIDKGVGRQEAYKMVQRNAKKVWGKSFAGVVVDERGLLPLAVELGNDPEVARYLSVDELKGLTSTDYYVKYIDTAFKRVGL